MPSPPSPSRTAGAVLLALLVCGAMVRLVPFLAAPALYLDEAMLALNIVTRTAAGLARPLDFEQTAPLLFLWLERGAVALAGAGERALRLVPLLSGLVLAPLCWRLARRILAPGPAVVAAGLAAFSPLAVWYANVAKPYALDAAVATTFLLLAARVREAPGNDRRLAMMTVLGSAAMFLSLPTVFLLPGVLIGLAVQAEVRRARGRLVRLALCAAVLGGAFLASYLQLRRPPSEEGFLLRFYARAFPWPIDDTLVQRVSEVVSGMTQLFYFGRAVDLPAGLLIATLALTGYGLWRLHRRGESFFVIATCGSLLSVTAAAFARRYPPVERLLLFLTPMLCIATAAGLWEASRFVPARLRHAGMVLLSVLLLTPAALYDVKNVLRPHGEGAEVRPLIQAYVSDHGPGEPVYLYARSIPIWLYYTTDWTRPDTARVTALIELARRIGPNSGNMPSRGTAVVREGFDLVLHTDERIELVGTPPGVEIVYAGDGRTRPDEGWAENEVSRMHEAGDRVWVFLTHHSTEVAEALEAGIRMEGGRVLREWTDWAVVLWYVEFTS